MAQPQLTRHALLRFGIFTVSVALALLQTSEWLGQPGLREVLVVHFAVVLATVMLPPSRHTQGVRIGLLGVDLVALATTACLALLPADGNLTTMLPFLAAYVVATLVSFVGHRGVAATLGGLAGVMVLGMGLFLMRDHIPETGFVFPQMVWIALAAIETTIIAGWLDQQDSRLAISTRVERELRSREAEAAEIVSLVEALLDASDVGDVAEAVLRHVRYHVPVRAHAIALETEEGEIAIWEETGLLEAVHVERRRLLLQKGLADAGSTMRLKSLDARSIGTAELPEKLDFRTAVDIPVRVAGRVAGVIFLADAERGALQSDRIGMMADVACRLGEALQRIERRRSAENRRVALLLREMREGVLLLGPEGQVLLANPAARRAIDASKLDGLVEPHLGEATLKELGRTPPGITRRFRAQLPGTDAGPRELACAAVSVVDGNSRVGTLVTLADITDEELARRRLIQAERSTLVGQTLAGVAHELNNPLAAMLGYADLIKSQDAPEALERPITRMCEQATRATKIVRNLLNFARRNNPQRVPVSLGDLVDGTVELFAYEARMANIEVETTIPEDLPRLLADKHAIQQILVNLFQNALHALAQVDDQETRHLWITAKVTGDEITLEVRDSGPGVPKEVRPRVFQPFFTTKAAEQGTGLGLALSVSIARDHGGDLLLAPDNGEGACFVLRLPYHASSPRDATVGAPIGKSGLPGYVLVVDDEPSVRETLVAQLGNLGSQVDSASSATEAERLLAHQNYDIVLLDVRMPGSSGLELHDALATQQPVVAKRVVFMTGDLANDKVLSGVMKTGNALLEKPFTMDELREAVAKTRDAVASGGDAPAYTLTA